LLSLVNFYKPLINQILIPDWTYFHCPSATLIKNNEFFLQVRLEHQWWILYQMIWVLAGAG